VVWWCSGGGVVVWWGGGVVVWWWGMVEVMVEVIGRNRLYSVEHLAQ